MAAVKSKLSRVFRALGPFLILAFVLALFAVVMKPDARETFFSLYNFKTILTQTVIVAIGALGMTMIIVSGGIDLSVGSVIAFTSVFGAVLIREQNALPWVITATILAGGLVGLANGALIAAFRLMPFIVTLGMLGIARGLAKWLADNQ